MSWFSLVIGQNASRQLATSSENLVASAQFLVALATSESQFRALLRVSLFTSVFQNTCRTSLWVTFGFLFFFWTIIEMYSTSSSIFIRNIPAI